MHKPFVASLTLRTAAVLSNRGYLMLDGLLASVLFSINQNLDDIKNIPLKQTSGIYHGSQALFNYGQVKAVPFVCRLGGRDGEPGAWIPNPDAKDGYGYRVLITKGKYKNLMDDRDVIESNVVMWFGCGDIDRVRELLSMVTGVGAKCAQGYGEVEAGSLLMMEIAEDYSIRMPDGSPARPIPLDKWTGEFGGKADSAPVNMAALGLPAWSSDFEICALPVNRILNLEKFAADNEFAKRT